MRKFVIIVAGGKGLRMGGDIPKQFLPIAGYPILMRTIMKFHQYDASMGVVVVLPEHQISYWTKLCADYHFDLPYLLAKGGETRFHSVKNGLSVIDHDSDVCVAVHDGVRPFVSNGVIDAAFREAERSGAAVPTVPLVDSIRKVASDGGNEARNRTDYRLVQTPQVFRRALYEQAAEQAQQRGQDFTDDCQLVEALGVQVTMTTGSYTNIKLTTPEDFAIAEALLKEIRANTEET